MSKQHSKIYRLFIYCQSMRKSSKSLHLSEPANVWFGCFLLDNSNNYSFIKIIKVLLLDYWFVFHGWRSKIWNSWEKNVSLHHAVLQAVYLQSIGTKTISPRGLIKYSDSDSDALSNIWHFLQHLFSSRGHGLLKGSTATETCFAACVLTGQFLQPHRYSGPAEFTSSAMRKECDWYQWGNWFVQAGRSTGVDLVYRNTKVDGS